MNIPDQLADKIIQVGRQLYARGLLAGSDGNISVRLDGGNIAITGAGIPKGRLTKDDLVSVNDSGQKLDGRRNPSSEMLMHLFAFRSRPDIQACVHAHPPFATAFAVAGKALQPDVLPEVVLFVGEIPLTDYAPPGTEAVPCALSPFIATHNAFLLRNHGLLTLGRTLEEAYERMETVEHLAHILYLATQLGRVEKIPPADFERLEKLRQSLQR